MKCNEILEQIVTEINMSPTNLRNLAANINAKVGMEFEMFVPTKNFYEQPGMDLTNNPPITNVESIINFFTGSEGRILNVRYIEEILSEFEESPYYKNKLKEILEKEIDEIVKLYARKKYENKLFNPRLSKKEKINIQNSVEQEASEILAKNDKKTLDKARKHWLTHHQYDRMQENSDIVKEYFEQKGISTMRDLFVNYQALYWPYRRGGTKDMMEKIANSFSAYVGVKVNVSTRYHGATRSKNAYALEPDSSLTTERTDIIGLEFISPPLPIATMLDQMNKIKEWAIQNKVKTTKKTGLHINVSIANWSGKVKDLDFVKLALLLGDQYILDQFGRSSNKYAVSAVKLIKKQIRTSPALPPVVLAKMRQDLNSYASQLIHSGVTEKYTSINVKDGYIEFRSPGGDWLNQNFDKIESSMLRFVVALDAATDPNKYREEYAKKLYKLLSPQTDESDIIDLFARYSAGTISKQQLKSKLKISPSITAKKTQSPKYPTNIT